MCEYAMSWSKNRIKITEHLRYLMKPNWINKTSRECKYAKNESLEKSWEHLMCVDTW